MREAVKPTATDRARLHDLATRVRAVAVDILPRIVRPRQGRRPDPLGGLCGFAAIGVVSASAELGYPGGVLHGTHSQECHLWARLDCGLDVDIAAPQFGLPPVLVMNRTEARRLGFRCRTGERNWLMRPGECDVRRYARQYGCIGFPAGWWGVALDESRAA